MTLALRFWAHSEVGRVRKNNQDAGYASPRMLVVADGMGGAAEGDLASAVAVTHVAKQDREVPGEQLLEFMAGVINRANDWLAELVEEDPSLDGMGTTFCGVAFDGQQFALGHIGDSRMYRLRDGHLQQITHDHSWVQSLIDEGRLTPEQAATHPHRSLILKVLNGQASPDPDYELFDAVEGDRLLLCSDGLSGLITDDRIHHLCSTIDDLSELSDALALAANQAGGHDNITVVLADVVAEAPAEQEPMVVGSAVERDIPRVGELAAASGTSNGEGYPEPEPDPEHVRYAPKESKKRGSLVLGLALTFAVVAGGIWGVTTYSSTRYFIAEKDGQVAIYNGLPGSLLGYELNRLEERRDTRIEDLPRYYQRAVGNTIGSPSLDDARTTADELNTLAEQCARVRAQRTARPTSSPTPAPPATSALPTTSPSPASTSTSDGLANYPTILAPVTPTASEEADPEAC